jgi:hypothetical protein
MKLRLRRADGAAEHARDLLVLMSFDVVQREDRAIAGGKLSNRFVERDAVNDRHTVWILGPLDDLHGRLAVLGRLLHPDPALPEMHQDLIDRQAMQPGRKSRLAAKASYFAKELDEDLLREVFGLRDVLRHPKAQGVNAAVMALVKLLEGMHIAPCGFLRQRVIRTWRCLGFGCGHKVPCSLRAAEGSPLLPDATRRTGTNRTRSPELSKEGAFSFRDL